MGFARIFQGSHVRLEKQGRLKSSLRIAFGFGFGFGPPRLIALGHGAFSGGAAIGGGAALPGGAAFAFRRRFGRGGGPMASGDCWGQLRRTAGDNCSSDNVSAD